MSIDVTVMATISSSAGVTLETEDMKLDGTGFYYELEEESTETVVVFLKGKTSTDHGLITGVRSVPTPDSGNGPWTNWTLTSTGDAWESPAFGLVSTLRIEVTNSGGANPVPQGGGHFRVVEEGGGGPL